VIPKEDEESDDTDAETVYETEIARMVVPGGRAKEVRRGGHRSDSESECVNWELLERTEEQDISTSKSIKMRFSIIINVIHYNCFVLFSL
jgi:hypothetical protein